MILFLMLLAASWPDIGTAPCTQYVSPEGSGWDCTAARPCSLRRGIRQYAQCGYVLCLQPGTYRPSKNMFVLNTQCRPDVPFILRSAIPDDPALICTKHDWSWITIDGEGIGIAHLWFMQCEELVG